MCGMPGLPVPTGSHIGVYKSDGALEKAAHFEPKTSENFTSSYQRILKYCCHYDYGLWGWVDLALMCLCILNGPYLP